ncbi:VanZ family protein [Microbacterium sp. GXF7504]
MTDAATDTVRGRILLAVLTAGYLAVLASLTLGPQPETAGGVIRALADFFGGWAPTAWIGEPLLEFCANIVLFVPAGLLACCWLPRRRALLAVAIGLALSALIELTQALLLPDRVPDVRDLVSNTLGSAVGLVMFRLFGPRPSRRR